MFKNLINIFIKILLYKKKLKLLKKLKFNYKNNIIFLGTSYGGWSFIDNNNLKNKFIISAGLGEDASFDIEIITKYNCKVISVDPTPKAIIHYNEIINNAGKNKSEPYAKDGRQNISSYDLTKINKKNFFLISKALYNTDNEKLKFYVPKNKDDVSHSLNDWQNNYKKTSQSILVKTITLKNILNKFKIKNLEILKLDIEGAEIEVIKNILDEKIFPKQILVEIDELNKINKLAINRFNEIHYKLLSENYNLIKTNNKFPNFLYSR